MTYLPPQLQACLPYSPWASLVCNPRMEMEAIDICHSRFSPRVCCLTLCGDWVDFDQFIRQVLILKLYLHQRDTSCKRSINARQSFADYTGYITGYHIAEKLNTKRPSQLRPRQPHTSVLCIAALGLPTVPPCILPSSSPDSCLICCTL